MGIETVFGHAGKPHVTGAQLARMLEGTCGPGRYVLKTQNKLNATMTDANTVRVDTGDLVHDGRLATCERYTDLRVDSGVSGMKRNDMVVARFTKSSDQHQLVVVKGAPTAGDPADPKLNAGAAGVADVSDMPLWRIRIDGISPKLERAFSFADTTAEAALAASRAAMTRTVDGDGSLVMQDNGGDGRKATRCRIGGMVWWNSVDEAWSVAVRVPGLPQDFWAVKTKLKLDVPAPAHEVRNAGMWIQTDDNPDGKLWYWGVTPLKAYIGSDGYLYLGHMATRPEWFAALCYVNILIET